MDIKVPDYFTGGELIDKLGCLVIEFVDGIRKQVVPYPSSEIDRSDRTPESDPALYNPALCESPQAWVDMVRAAKFHKFKVSGSWQEMLHKLGHCWERVPDQEEDLVSGHEQQVEDKEPTTIILPTNPGTMWDQIRIRIATNDRFEIGRPGYEMEIYNSQQLGLQKAKTKLALLKIFGLSGGELKKNITKDASPANMSNLRKLISGIFPEVEGNPIQINEDGCYVCQFQICVNKEEFSREHYTSDGIADEDNGWDNIMGARS